MRAAIILYLALLLTGLGLRLALDGEGDGWWADAPAVLLAPDTMTGDVTDERWLPLEGEVMEGYEGPFWIRIFVTFERDDIRFVRITATSSYEAWWDRHYLGSNGRLDLEGNEVEVGRIDRLISIPPELAQPGVHTLVLRANMDASPQNYITGWADFLAPDDLPFAFIAPSLVAVLTAFLALGSAAVFLILSFRQPSRVQVIYIAFCLSFFLLGLVEASRNVIGYTYVWQVPRLQAVAALTALTGLLLNAFLVAYFRLRHLVWLVPVLTFTLVAIYLAVARQFDLFGVIAALVCVASAVGLSIWAVVRAMPGAWTFLAALAGGLAIVALNLDFVDEWGVFVLFLVFTSTVNVRLATGMRDLDRSLAESRLKSLRLRHEFSRRFIQPHFMLNTLTAISEWITKSPQQAELAVSELAGEVRVLGRMIDRDLVPLPDEIDLCERLCQVMSRRLQTQFRLDVVGEGDGMIPPAVLHTQVENVFSHNRYVAAQVVLRLDIADHGKMRTFRLVAPLGDEARSLPGGGTAASGRGGLAYVEARLAEA